MRIVFTLLLSLVLSGVFAQTLTELKPRIFLNSEEIDLEDVHLNLSRVDNMRVSKEDARGAIYITTKQPVVLLTLDDVLKRNNINIIDSGQVVYKVKDKLVTDMSKVKIDASLYIVVDVKRFDTLNYINEAFKTMILVEIQLLDKKPEPVIRIRGSEGPEANNELDVGIYTDTHILKHFKKDYGPGYHADQNSKLFNR